MLNATTLLRCFQYTVLSMNTSFIEEIEVKAKISILGKSTAQSFNTTSTRIRTQQAKPSAIKDSKRLLSSRQLTQFFGHFFIHVYSSPILPNVHPTDLVNPQTFIQQKLFREKPPPPFFLVSQKTVCMYTSTQMRDFRIYSNGKKLSPKLRSTNITNSLISHIQYTAGRKKVRDGISYGRHLGTSWNNF